MNILLILPAADTIERSLTKTGYQVSRQGYEINWLKDRPCYNLEVEIRGADHPNEIVVICAHYDSEELTPGANDNASGVAAMLAFGRRIERYRGGSRRHTLWALNNHSRIL